MLPRLAQNSNPPVSATPPPSPPSVLGLQSCYHSDPTIHTISDVYGGLGEGCNSSRLAFCLLIPDWLYLSSEPPPVTEESSKLRKPAFLISRLPGRGPLTKCAAGSALPK